MQKLLAALAASLMLACALPLLSQSTQPTVYISPDGGFQTALSAAMFKKHVPITLVSDANKAEYVLQATAVDSKGESGVSKLARCAFAYCAGINGNSEVSVQLTRRDTSAIVWAYQVKKGNAGPKGIQSLSEAVAKHLNDDFLKKQK